MGWLGWPSPACRAPLYHRLLTAWPLPRTWRDALQGRAVLGSEGVLGQQCGGAERVGAAGGTGTNGPPATRASRLPLPTHPPTPSASPPPRLELHEDLLGTRVHARRGVRLGVGHVAAGAVPVQVQAVEGLPAWGGQAADRRPRAGEHCSLAGKTRRRGVPRALPATVPRSPRAPVAAGVREVAAAVVHRGADHLGLPAEVVRGAAAAAGREGRGWGRVAEPASTAGAAEVAAPLGACPNPHPVPPACPAARLTTAGS